MPAELLKVQDIHLRFGGLIALNSVSLEVNEGEIFAIIGPNGAGKTCLINCISGFYHPERGKILFQGQEIAGLAPHRRAKLGISRTFQNIALYSGMSVLDNITTGRHLYIRSNLFAQGLYFGGYQAKEVEHREAVEDIIDFLELGPVRNQVVGALAYGLRKRVELGRALALEPKLLLLDEPIAGMNVDEKEEMARFVLDIQETKGITEVLIEHDMGVVMDISDRITVLDFGIKIAEGTPDEIRRDPKVIKAYLGEEEVVV